ncbi:TIGR03560 family F420-dependent LLM class oxidoreductase [Paractinoplanes deccanensis]|nr:TIGR03560 family F420-dependent LLM class oxidoreductase [Actinoplanes deccanensis]
MSVSFGVFVPQGWKMDLVEIADPEEQYEAMTAVARVADAGPWDSIWLYDHLHTWPEPTMNTTFECWTATSTLARDTSRVNIGQMVGCNGYRQPSLYAKIASTVDVASKGRLYAGLGAGWYEHEWKAYGYRWEDVPTRMAEFREAVEIIHKMWTEDRPVFQGKHYSIDAPINQPRRKPSFWLGGGGEKVTLKLVAQYADGCNVGAGDPALVRHKLGVLREHCERLGRDYSRIRKSTTIELDLTQSTKDTIGHVERLAEAGADYVLFYIPRVAYDHSHLLRLAEEVVPQFS